MPNDAKHLKSVELQTDGARLVLINFGATSCDWRIELDGASVPLLLGYENLHDFLTSSFFFGAIVGRVSNRIGGGGFELPDGPVHLDQNEGETTLHGGPKSLGRVFWDIEKTSDNTAHLTYHSPHGENGFPGNVDFEVLIELHARQIRYVMTAKVDRPTPISMAQHNYYNLGGKDMIWDYALQMNSQDVLKQNNLGVCTGVVECTVGGDWDFRTSKSLSALKQSGLDAHFVFDGAASDLRKVAEVRAPNGLGLTFHSDQGGAQIYTSHGLTPTTGGINGARYDAGSGLCFEPQGHPNAVNIPSFPSMIVTPDNDYRQELVVEVTGA